MSKAYLIEHFAHTLGLIVFDRESCAFFAAHPHMRALDGAIFPSRAQAERAVRRRAREAFAI
jgi:hypothetical protein